MDLDAFLALLTPSGQKALAEAAELTGADPVGAATRMRRTYDASLTSAALTQAALRARAKVKFGADAELMYFTPHGLEQSTHSDVAAHRTHRLASLMGPRLDGLRVVDVCCGIGGDFLALARAGCTVDAVDLDPLTAAVAKANADALGLSARVSVRTADAAAIDPSGYDVLFADPARRTSRGRTFDPQSYSPPWPVVLDLIARAPAACLKVAPGLPYDYIPEDAEAEWVSHRGEVKEAALWTGPLARRTAEQNLSPDHAEAPNATPSRPAGGEAPDVEPSRTAGGGGGEHPWRRATLLPGGHTLSPTGAKAATGPVARYVYEPDGAAIRAHLVAEVADLVHGHLADPMIAYITSDEAIDTPWASRYEVYESLPFSLKRLRAALRARETGNVTIKKRGSAIDIEKLRNDLRLSGDKSTVVILTRVMDKPFALLCTPCPPG